MKKNKIKSFRRKEAENHIKEKMPNIPGELRWKIVQRVIRAKWDAETTLGAAVGIQAHNFIRHNLTEYERLMNFLKVDRETARLMVKPEVDRIFREWQKV